MRNQEPILISRGTLVRNNGSRELGREEKRFLRKDRMPLEAPAVCEAPWSQIERQDAVRPRPPFLIANTLSAENLT